MLNELPDKLLIGRGFCRKNGLRMDLTTNTGRITVDVRQHCGPVGRESTRSPSESVCKILEGEDVDFYLNNDMDYKSFSEDEFMQRKLKRLLWERREIFKGLGCIKGVTHEIKLRDDVKPISEKLRRRSPKEQDIEREAMRQLIALGVLEPSVSPWASSDVFVRKKDGIIRVTADFRALNDATVTDSYPMEDMRQVLDWLGSKRIFSCFDLKDAFYQVELSPESRPLTAIRTVVGLLQYTARTGTQEFSGHFATDRKRDFRQS